MLRNPFARLQDLLGRPPRQAGTVASVSSGIAQITLPGGGSIAARGAATVGARVFVRDGVIEGPAPTLPVEIIEV